jgi:L-arabinose transport system substrate-binding protein
LTPAPEKLKSPDDKINLAKLNMHTKLFRWLALSTSLVVLAGCGNQGGTDKPASSKEGIKLGFIVKQPEEPWFQLEWKFAGETATKDNFELIKIGATDGEKVLAAIDNLAANGAKGFVICTPDTRLGPAIMARAKSHNLKVISVDDQFLGADGKPMSNVHYLGISARKIGESIGQALIDEMKKRNWPQDETAVCVVTFDELDTAKERTEGATQALKTAGFPEAKVFKVPQKTSDIPGAFDAVNILLTQHADVKRWLICGMNDSAVLGAVRAMEGRGFKADNVIGIGINGTDCIVEFEKPTVTGFFASALLAPKRHGSETSEMLYKWVKDGVEPPLDTRTTGILINRENFKTVLKEQGIKD